jgi:hypothetical protein
MKKLLNKFLLTALVVCSFAGVSLAQTANMEGSVSYRCAGKRAKVTCSLYIAFVTYRTSQDTLPLTATLTMTQKKYSGGLLNGNWLARKSIGSLSAGYYFSDIVASNSGRLKLKGKFYPVITISDSSGSIHSYVTLKRADLSKFRGLETGKIKVANSKEDRIKNNAMSGF